MCLEILRGSDQDAGIQGMHVVMPLAASALLPYMCGPARARDSRRTSERIEMSRAQTCYQIVEKVSFVAILEEVIRMEPGQLTCTHANRHYN